MFGFFKRKQVPQPEAANEVVRTDSPAPAAEEAAPESIPAEPAPSSPPAAT